MHNQTRPLTRAQFLDSNQAAEYLGLKRSTLEAWRCRGTGPTFCKLGRLVKYRQADLDAFIQSRMREHTAEYGFVNPE